MTMSLPTSSQLKNFMEKQTKKNPTIIKIGEGKSPQQPGFLLFLIQSYPFLAMLTQAELLTIFSILGVEVLLMQIWDSAGGMESPIIQYQTLKVLVAASSNKTRRKIPFRCYEMIHTRNLRSSKDSAIPVLNQ